MATEIDNNRQFVLLLNVRLHNTPPGDDKAAAFADYKEAANLARTIQAATSGRLRLTAAELQQAREAMGWLRTPRRAAAAEWLRKCTP